jgi:DNA-directed RNA polymerase subunit omega
LVRLGSKRLDPLYFAANMGGLTLRLLRMGSPNERIKLPKTLYNDRPMKHLILPKEIDSKFRFIIVAAQRAKQLQAGAKPRVLTTSYKPTRVAIEEVLAGAVSWEMKAEVPRVTNID